MRVEDSVWQGSFGYWQNLFIHQNILPIGHTAWNGFLHRGRGLVACQINTPINGSVNWSVDTIKYDLQFISQLYATAYLQKLELEENTVSNLLSIIASYEPKEAIIFCRSPTVRLISICCKTWQFRPLSAMNRYASAGKNFNSARNPKTY